MLVGLSCQVTLFCMMGLLGCGGSGGGSGASSGPLPTASASDLQVSTLGPSEVELSFELIDPTGQPQVIEIEYSSDRGASYSPATLSGHPTNSLSVGPGGGTFQVEWQHSGDLENQQQGDLQLRVTPWEAATMRQGESAESEVFSVGSNTPPEIVSVTTPSTIVGGVIEFPVTLLDAESDFVGVDLEYSFNSGETWYPGTAGAGSNSSLATSPTGLEQSVYWQADADAGGTISSLTLVRLTPIDFAEGSAVTTNSFSVHLVTPEITALTVGEISNSMNGTTTWTGADGSELPFHLRVISSGFDLRVDTASGPGGAAVDPASLEVISDRDLGSRLAGEDLGALFSGNAESQVWSVPQSHALPEGWTTFHARVQDIHGNTSPWREFEIESHPGNGDVLPFDWTDRWWIDFSLDQFSLSTSGTTSVTVTSTWGPNGIPDHLEDLQVCGLQSANPLPGCVALGSNAIVQDWVEGEILGRLHEFYGGDFDGTVAGYAPNLEFSRSSAGRTSSIRIGGDDSEAGFALGRAMFDDRNHGGNHNRGPNLGVFTTNLIQFYVNSFYFRQRFGPLMPEIGVPVGENLWDEVILAPTFDRFDPLNSIHANLRYDAIWLAIEAWGRSVAVILAHEIGHSIGLCQNGAPPSGLFGGASNASFAGLYTTPFHIDSPGNNIMAAALSFSTSLISGPDGYQFNALNIAYLRQWNLLGF